ncbi:hypothetical protein D3C80_1338280 [compost metagenome]
MGGHARHQLTAELAPGPGELTFEQQLLDLHGRDLAVPVQLRGREPGTLQQHIHRQAAALGVSDQGAGQGGANKRRSKHGTSRKMIRP